jgi:hypothetical protein
MTAALTCLTEDSYQQFITFLVPQPLFGCTPSEVYVKILHVVNQSTVIIKGSSVFDFAGTVSTILFQISRPFGQALAQVRL